MCWSSSEKQTERRGEFNAEAQRGKDAKGQFEENRSFLLYNDNCVLVNRYQAMTEPTAYNVTVAHITRNPEVRGGKPCIAGRGIKVQNVYIWHEHLGMSADEIASAYDLSLVQVYAALTYAFEHLDEIRNDIRESEAFVEEFMKQNPSKLREMLLGNDQ
jgi:uncharacterized protein (DUF433 family)